ncbi:MAG: biotin carboxylase N-terminal domain-containing protein [Geminicoccaceae bacterium]
MLGSVLIANRGEIAARIIRTCRRLGIRSVVVYSDADRNALHVEAADEAIRLGPAPAAQSYLAADKVIRAAERAGVEAIHPGYGFLSENAGFAAAVRAAGLIFIGPPEAAIEAMGVKDRAKRIMADAGVPVIRGAEIDREDGEADLEAKAAEVGYPLLLKAVAGGGGKGMRIVEQPAQLADSLRACRREAGASFGDETVLMERYLANPRHVEVQVIADGHGRTVHLFERDCSLQRRHQKIIEEAPAPNLTRDERAEVGLLGVEAARAVGYVGAGTVEFLYQNHQFHFIEMNTRLQVEHPVTEAVTGLDLVELQLRVASGEHLGLDQDALRCDGHALEARLYAEDTNAGFLPSIGRLDRLDWGESEARIDTGVRAGDEVTPFYDPMIAKLVVWAEDRHAAITKLRQALSSLAIAGVETNRGFLLSMLSDPAFVAAEHHTAYVDGLLPGTASEPPPEALVAAALFQLDRFRGEAERRDPGSPWSLLDGWRIGENASIRVALAHDGAATPLEIEVVDDRLTVHGDGQTWQVRRGADRAGRMRFELEDALHSASVVPEADGLRVSLDRNDWRFSLTSETGTAADERAADQIRAPMPGRIVSLGVKQGQEVAAGESLLSLEAMKMEHRMTAPFAARIDQLLIAEGDQVAAGDLLVVLEPAA